MKSIIKNKKAKFEYEIIKTYEAGIVLNGPEVKSIREGKVSIKNSFGQVANGEAYIYDMHIAPYEKSRKEINPKRERKLLLHSYEIRRIQNYLENKGMAFIPLEVYIDRGLIKVLMGVAKGKKEYEKRDKIKRKEQEREILRNL